MKEEVAEVTRWAEGIDRVHECIAGRFRRPAAPSGAGLSERAAQPVERKNGWQLAERAGDANGVQRLLQKAQTQFWRSGVQHRRAD